MVVKHRGLIATITILVVAWVNLALTHDATIGTNGRHLTSDEISYLAALAGMKQYIGITIPWIIPAIVLAWLWWKSPTKT